MQACARQYSGGGASFRRFAMWVIFLEAALALCLLFLMVWATWPKRRGKPEAEKNREERDE